MTTQTAILHDLVYLLLNRQMEGDSRPILEDIHNFIQAAGSGDQATVLAFLDKYKQYPDAIDIQSVNTYMPVTALFTAIQAGQDEMVELLLLKGADIDAVTSFRTALFDALLNSNADLALFLLKKGANIDADIGYGRTALQEAFLRGYNDMAFFLLEQGADPHKKDNNGHTTLEMLEAEILDRRTELKESINFVSNPTALAYQQYMREYIEALTKNAAVLKNYLEKKEREKAFNEAARRMDVTIQEKQKRLKVLSRQHKFKPRP